MTTKAVYAGSFDPITLGHMDLIERAYGVFDEVIIAIGVNSSKKPVFTTEERIELIKQSAMIGSWEPRITIESFEGLLVNFCKKVQANVIIRGLRAVSDFEYELGIAHANRSQAPKIDTFFLPTKPEYSFVSSSIVREIAKYGGDLSKYVTPVVDKALRAKFA